MEELSRVARMTATMGFLREPQLNQIAHTELSASFSSDFTLMDCAMFLGEVAAPTTLYMTEATSRVREDRASSSAFSLYRGTQQSFGAACAGEERLQRQWTAYRMSICARSDSVVEALCRLNWTGLGKACVVHVGCPRGCRRNRAQLTTYAIQVAASTMEIVTSLARVAPLLHFIVQKVGKNIHLTPGSEDMHADINERITVLDKMPAGIQLVKDAAVYILHLTISHSLRSHLLAELTAHAGLLRANPSAVMIVAPPLLPEPGSVRPEIEAEARARDLTGLQLAQETGLELSELIEIVNGFGDRDGRLAVVNRIRFDNGMAAAVSVKYELRSSFELSRCGDV